MVRLIAAAINGPRTRAEHPAIPTTPEQQALAAAESVAAGSGAIHVHVRGPDERESLAPEDVARALTAIRAAVPGIAIGVSTGAWIVPDPAARLQAVGHWSLLPDFASVNFHEDGATELAELLRSRGVGIEAGLSNARAAEVLLDSGLAGHYLRVMFEPQDQDADAALGALAQMEGILDHARIGLPRLLHGVDRTTWRLIDAAAARGYDTRVGFEDTLTLPDGTLAPSNAALVAAARRAAG
ncbi:MAG: 3-keto-5-aminohexanoate cleavage protein [Gemmatimonadales bacterium]